jgi:hypothetical protein
MLMSVIWARNRFVGPDLELRLFERLEWWEHLVELVELVGLAELAEFVEFVELLIVLELVIYY